MGRPKKLNKNEIVSCSIPGYQKKFIKTHPNFDFSKFVQVRLKEHMDYILFLESQLNSKEENKDDIEKNN